MPNPKVTWDVAIREKTTHNIWTKWRDAPCSGRNDQSLNWTVAEVVGLEECSLRRILSEHLRSGRRFLHLFYHEVHQRDRTSKPHHRMARLEPGRTGSLLYYDHQDHVVNLHEVGPILHVLLGRYPLLRRRSPWCNGVFAILTS